jgi:hypothetical protein
LDFNKIQSFWKFGGFSSIVVNGTSPDNPWVQSQNANAPFDQEFYLILNVAVGAGNGYFPYVFSLQLNLFSSPSKRISCMS